MDERWHGNLFQVSEATDENDLDLAIAVFREGMHIDKEEEDRSDCARTFARTFVLRIHPIRDPRVHHFRGQLYANMQRQGGQVINISIECFSNWC